MKFVKKKEPTQQDHVSINKDQQQQSGFFSSRKRPVMLGLIIFFVLLNIALIITTMMLQSPQQQPTTQDKVVALVGDQQIYKSTVEQAASESYAKSAINKKTLESTLNLLIERAILDHEAKTTNIAVTEQEIQQKAKTITSTANVSKKMLDTAKYELLKERILARFIRSKEIYKINFWLPPPSASESATLRQQRADGVKVLNEAEERLRKNENPLTVARDLYKKYPSLQRKLMLNTRPIQLENTGDMAVYNTPYHYALTSDHPATKESAEYKAVMSMKSGDVQKIQEFGGAVIKVVSEELGTYKNYEDFLEAKRKELVKIVAAL